MSESVADELRARLHPANELDIPQPGFPSHLELVEWAKAQDDQEAVRAAALDMLTTDAWPQQYACMGLLRALGVSVEGEGFGDDFRWVVEA